MDLNLKMPKSQEQSEQLQNKELESIAGERLNDLVKNLSLRGKVAKWAAVTASIVGISFTMATPAGAIRSISPCYEDDYVEVTYGGRNPSACYADAGEIAVDLRYVRKFSSGNNAGYVVTDKGRVTFGKWTGYDFKDNGWGLVTITRIVIY